ncbi:MAG: cation:proton antiporter [Pseudomonadales bacterium]|nr:cation:proton antiporter [Pseudomonadales bacterium]
METTTLTILASIGIISLILQWLAWQLRLPAILFLLLAGIILGPVVGWIQPDQMFGDLLFPLVSLSVAVILFEGSLTLELKDIKGHGKMVRNLLSIGILISFFVGAVAAKLALGLSWSIALLFGSIIVVTGPTVIMPLLRAVRPKGNLANILKWEGIIIDPIGALLAVLVYELIISGQQHAIEATVATFSMTLLVGIGLGCLSGYLLGIVLRRHWLPQFLQNAGTLTFMLGVYAISNEIVHESGLLTVTVMGIWMANMRGVPVDDILEFKESLSVLLISALFIILAARLDFSTIAQLGWGTVWVLLAIIFIARPLGVWLSAIGTQLSWQDKTFLSWIAPRGIVAAAVSSLFAFRLEDQVPDAALLVPLVFMVIIATVVLQSLTARVIAGRLEVVEPETNGYLFVGANQVARAVAKALLQKKVQVLVTDTNWEYIKQARMDGLPVYYGNPVSEHAENHMEITGIGNMLAISPYKQLNTQATFHFLDLFGKGHVFGLSEGDEEQTARHKSLEKIYSTRGLFGEGVTFGKLASLISRKASVKTTQLTEEYTFSRHKEKHGNRLIPLFAVSPNGIVQPFSATTPPKPTVGWDVISLIAPETGSTNGVTDKAEPSPQPSDGQSTDQAAPTKNSSQT